MDDDEDFQALFFVECDENLTDLQTRLDALRAGDTDPETVNAAFRAVHSVKGGAAAFGFEGVVRFAHEFETVMDRIRSATLDLTPDICETLLRAADVMSGLIEAVRGGTEGPTAQAARLSAQLSLLTAPAAAEPATPEPAGPEPVTEAAPVEEAYEYVEPPIVSVHVVPGPNFLLAGFDPIKMIRAAKAHGMVSVAVEGQVPGIETYQHGDCPLSWRMEFELDGPLADLERFFAAYAYGAEVTITPPEGEPEAVAAAEAPIIKPTAAVAAPPPTVAAAEPLPAADPTPVPAKAAEPAPAKAAKPAVSQPEAPEKAPKAAAAASRSLRVDLDRVDRLVNLVGEVLIAQSAVAQGIGEGGGAEQTMLKPLIEALTRQTRELQESVMAIRAQPVRSVFQRLPRVVRDLSDALGKEARLVMQGEDVEVDTTVIEELTEPLMHMIRNAMDHGVEMPEVRRAAGKPAAGTLTLSAEQRGGRVRIVLSDDGGGINRDLVLAKARAKGLVPPDEPMDAAAIEALIFHPGFSTASQISSVSGRGVGMDVVRRKIQSLGGRCVVAGNPGRGTTFTITLPLTLAVMDGMAVRVDDQQFILPVASVIEAITVDPAVVSRLPNDAQILKLRGAFLPLLSLRHALALPEMPPGPATAIVVDTETNGHVVVLVDELLGQRQIVLKSLEGNVGQIDGVGGATILGDGQVALVLELPALFRLGPMAAAELERMH